MLALAIASCGTGGGSSQTTPKLPRIAFKSPAVTAARIIPARYKCSTRNAWVPLKWGSLPAGTQELALYIVRFGAPKATASGQVKAEVKAEELVVGLKATLRQIKPGKYPHGALVAVHSHKGEVKSVCPPKAGVSENFLFRLYALDHKLHITRTSKVNPLQAVTTGASAAGTFIVRYRST
jgi:phosphatidylethanolamine-binding protein (PEBP) family uncharacterized protein